MKFPPPSPVKLICKWEWNKLPLAERKSTYHCLCHSVCYKKKEEREERIEKAKGFLQRLWAYLS
jgi:hypothetical protein